MSFPPTENMHLVPCRFVFSELFIRFTLPIYTKHQQNKKTHTLCQTSICWCLFLHYVFFFVTPIGVPMSFQETWSLVTLPISLYAVRCKLVLQCLVWADLWILCSLPLNCQKFVFFYSVARIYLLSPKANATNDSLRPFYCVSWRIIYAIFRLQFKIIFRAAAVAVKAEEGNSSICVICRHIHIIRHIITKIYKYSCRFFFCCFFFLVFCLFVHKLRL